MEKKTLCDGISHCPKAEDENCYKPCCDGIELELDGTTHYLMKKQLTEDDTDVKDSYFQDRSKMTLYLKIFEKRPFLHRKKAKRFYENSISKEKMVIL